MTAHKRQHYVPQSYLRNFAVPGTNEKAIGLLRVRSWTHVGGASIDGVAQEAFYYGRDLVIEKELQRIERETAPVFRSMIEGAGVPEPGTTAMTTVLRYVATQAGRTPSALKSAEEQRERTVHEVIATHPPLPDPVRAALRETKIPALAGGVAVPLAIWSEAPLLLQDLRVKVLVAPDGVELITSDAPVVRHNRWAGVGAVGAASPISAGLLLMMPLSPRHLLLLFDAEIYRVGPSHDDYVPLLNADEVAGFNGFQIEAAGAAAFYSSPTTRDAIDRLRVVDRDAPRWTGTSVPSGRGTHYIITGAVGSRLPVPRGTIQIRDDVDTVPKADRARLTRVEATDTYQRLRGKMVTRATSRAGRR